MTNEEMQKAMEFIVEQEARSAAKIKAIADLRWEPTERRIRALLTVATSYERQLFDRMLREHKRNYRRIEDNTRKSYD